MHAAVALHGPALVHEVLQGDAPTMVNVIEHLLSVTGRACGGMAGLTPIKLDVPKVGELLLWKGSLARVERVSDGGGGYCDFIVDDGGNSRDDLQDGSCCMIYPGVHYKTTCSNDLLHSLKY